MGVFVMVGHWQAACCMALSGVIAAVYARSVCKPKVFYHQTNEKVRSIVEQCKTMHSTFWPLPLSTGPYLQTIVPSFIREDIEIPYTREYLKLSDGGTVALDWWTNGVKSKKSTIILVCPGLTGTTKTKYIAQSANYLMNSLIEKHDATKQLSIVVFNYRGNAGAPLTAPRSYNGSDTEDLREVVNHLNENYSDSVLLSVGYSLGSNILTKYIGEEGENCKIHSAISISNPFNFNKSTTYWNGWKFEYLLGSHLARFLKQNLLPHIEFFQNAGFKISKEEILSCRTVQEFDERFTIVVGGWNSVEEYYDCASSEQFLKDIRIPVLFINAEDDPLSPGDVAPMEEFKKNPNLILVQTSKGGHIGWCQLKCPRGPAFYDHICAEFFENIIPHVK